MRRPIRFAIICAHTAVGITFLVAMPLWAQPVMTQETVFEREEIPRVGYQSWSLFLVCTPDWVMPERSEDLRALYWRFQAFGDAIGKQNASVWFWKERVPRSTPNLSRNLDVARSAVFCKALALRPSDGPFLVITSAYPELSNFPKDRAVFALGGLPPADVTKLLNKLTDDLATVGAVEPAAASAEQAAPGFWIRLLEGTRRSMIGIGCAVKLQITTGLLTAELRGCSQ